VGAAEADALRAVGLDDPAIHDAIQVIAYFNYINRVAEGVGTDLEPDWEPRSYAAADRKPSRRHGSSRSSARANPRVVCREVDRLVTVLPKDAIVLVTFRPEHLEDLRPSRLVTNRVTRDLDQVADLRGYATDRLHHDLLLGWTVSSSLVGGSAASAVRADRTTGFPL
jgi:hypothetical protein